MRNKVVILLVASSILTSLCLAEAQQATKTTPRIGFISASSADSSMFDAFQRGLRDLGYLDGKNILIEHRYAEGRLDRMPTFVHEFVQQKVDIIVAANNVVIRAAKEATKTIPIVMLSSIDPVEAGYVQSFARPGGNITGLTHMARDISAKRVELLKELLPKLSRVGILWDGNGPGPAVAFKEYDVAARAFKLDLRSLEVRGPKPDFIGAFQTAKTARLDSLIVVANPLMGQHAKEVFELATRNHLPSLTEGTRYVEAGGLISYGTNLADLYRRSAAYVTEILNGAKPGDLPVKLAEKFEIFVNLNTAKQIGVVIPQRVLVQADKVIK
jgi:putative tryptophan/tyrosine transport system substrate-binding protein